MTYGGMGTGDGKWLVRAQIWWISTHPNRKGNSVRGIYVLE